MVPLRILRDGEVQSVASAERRCFCRFEEGEAKGCKEGIALPLTNRSPPWPTKPLPRY